MMPICSYTDIQILNIQIHHDIMLHKNWLGIWCGREYSPTNDKSLNIGMKVSSAFACSTQKYLTSSHSHYKYLGVSLQMDKNTFQSNLHTY